MRTLPRRVIAAAVVVAGLTLTSADLRSAYADRRTAPALSFTGLDLDAVDHGSAASLDDIAAGTLLALVNCADVTPADGVFAVSKSGSNWMLVLRGPGLGNDLSWQIGRATTALHARATQANLPAFLENRWVWLAATWNTAGSDSDQRLYAGGLTTPLVEAAAYVTQTVGSGSVTSNAAANLFVGNTSAGNSNSFPGLIALVKIWNRRLSLDELRRHQSNLACSAQCVLFAWPGKNGRGTVFDESGNNNHGTITGAIPTADTVPVGRGFFSAPWR